MPFWVIMELENHGNVTGNYMTLPNQFNNEYDFLIPLFFSKYVALEYSKFCGADGCVRGVHQMQLRALYSFAKLHNYDFVEIVLEPDREKQGLAFLLRPEELKKKYIL